MQLYPHNVFFNHVVTKGSSKSISETELRKYKFCYRLNYLFFH